ncbi:hypothetical protein V2J09_014226 [Rumex salicifolius]
MVHSVEAELHNSEQSMTSFTTIATTEDDPSTFLSQFLKSYGGYAVVDGGLATELQLHGADLNDPLCSAICLLTSPDLIRTVHLDYIEAGASIIISNSYQATIEGFEAKGLSKTEGENLLRKSVEIAREARDIYYQKETSTRRPILVAASIGSYGAYLADGSEYSGDYGELVTLETLKEFHRRRLQVLVESEPDLIAFETIPNKLEAKAYSELLEEEGIKLPVWFSFSCKDSENVVNGDTIFECALIADSCKNVAAIGVNCTPPKYVHELIQSIKKAANKAIIVYPFTLNNGEKYDATNKQWVPTNGGITDEEFVSYVVKWLEAGASLIGGCCKTTPNTIRAIAKKLSKN